MKKNEGNLLAMAVISDKSEVVARIVECLTEDKQERVAMYLLGIINPDEELAETAVIDGKNCTLESYNWLEDEVRYHYFESVTRYFRNENDADYAAKNGERYAGNSEKNERYIVERTYNALYSYTTSKKIWKDGNVRG